MKKKAVSMLALLMAVLLCLSGCSQSEKPRSEAQSAEQIIQEEIVVDEEAVQAQSIGLTGVLNARELGGYLTEDGRMVKHGVFLRTAALGEATEEDLQRLQNVYHLSVVADLRRDSEVESDPDPEIPGVRNIHLRIMDEAALKEKQKKLGLLDIIGIVKGNRIDKLKLALKMGVISDQMYVDFLSNDQGKEGYAQMFQELLALPEGQAFLFHCTQGKDRTGLAAALILSALGVDEETDVEVAEKSRQAENYAGRVADSVSRALDAPAQSMSYAERAVSAEAGQRSSVLDRLRSKQEEVSQAKRKEAPAKKHEQSL
jgi:protein-tyrosine phosphatase